MSIDIEHVSYGYPTQATGADQARLAVHDVSLHIARGEYIALLGHNGSGKSTLARLCNGLLLPDSGHVLVNGLDTRDTSSLRSIRDTVGMIFQNPDNQIIATIVEDDIAWSLAMRGFAPELIAERVEHAMTAVDIKALRRLPPHKLSGGQRQRVAIAGILALQPQYIIADEATAMLDPLSRREIVELLQMLNKKHGITIIHVTHLLEEAAYAQRVIVLAEGQVVKQETPAEMFADLQQLRALNLSIPEIIELSTRLRNAGVPLSPHAVTVEAIARELTS